MYPFQKYIKQILESKFNVDVIWNVCSFVLCGVVGILLNVIIIRYYNAATLGFFNQIYAVFIFLSQIATWGIHLSVQKYIPQYATQRKHTSIILTTAFVVTFLFSSLITIIAIYFSHLPGDFLNSELVSKGFIYAVPGLVFFALNKVILAYKNGMRQMVAFAIFNFLRYALMLLFLVYLLLAGIEVKYLALIFSVPEIILFVILLLSIINDFSLQSKKRFIVLSILQFRFGSNAALGHIVLDINSKVDVLILGLFQPDKEVGIYSFAAFIVDGLLQLFYVFRTNINPIITDTFYRDGRVALERIVKKNVTVFYKIFVTAGLMAILLYPIFLHLVKVTELFWLNFLIFALLTLGCILASGYIPFQMIFNQIGLPRLQSIFLFIIFGINVILNFILVPIWSTIGSAVATSLVFIIQAVILKKLVASSIRIKI